MTESWMGAHANLYLLLDTGSADLLHSRVKSGNFGHQVNSDSELVCFILKID